MKTTRRRFIQLTSGLLVPASAYGQLTLRSAAYAPLLKRSASAAPFVPSDYGTVWAWYRNSTLSSYSGGVWADSSGNGRDTSQGTSGYRPTYSAASLNGLDALSFDGTDDGLNAPNCPDDLSIFVLTRLTVAGSSQTSYAPLWIGSQSGAGGGNFCVKLGGNNWGTYTSGDLSAGEELSSATNYCMTLTNASATGCVLQRDGVTKASSGSISVSDSVSQIGSQRGLSRYFNGLISEILIYSGKLTGSNLTAVNDYIKGLGGIA